jgi:drug/metabolite transporter (DMT)-like permease
MLGITLAFGCAVFLALAQLMLRKSYRELQPSVGFFFDAIFGLLLWVPLALIMGASLGANLGEAIVFAIISAILSEAMYFFALSHGELAVTATVLATYPVYTVLFSRVINDEVLSASLLFFVVVTIVGSIIASMPDKIKKSEMRLRKEIVWPFVAAIGIGLSDTLSKGFINRSEDFSFLFALGFVQLPVALAYLRLERERVSHITKVFHQLALYKNALLGGLFNIVGTGLLWLSFSYAPASIASPITGTSGALTVLLARFALTEHVSARKYLGIVLAFVGIIGIALVRS